MTLAVLYVALHILLSKFNSSAEAKERLCYSELWVVETTGADT